MDDYEVVKNTTKSGKIGATPTLNVELGSEYEEVVTYSKNGKKLVTPVFNVNGGGSTAETDPVYTADKPALEQRLNNLETQVQYKDRTLSVTTTNVENEEYPANSGLFVSGTICNIKSDVDSVGINFFIPSTVGEVSGLTNVTPVGNIPNSADMTLNFVVKDETTQVENTIPVVLSNVLNEVVSGTLTNKLITLNNLNGTKVDVDVSTLTTLSEVNTLLSTKVDTSTYASEQTTQNTRLEDVEVIYTVANLKAVANSLPVGKEWAFIQTTSTTLNRPDSTTAWRGFWSGNPAGTEIVELMHVDGRVYTMAKNSSGFWSVWNPRVMMSDLTKYDNHIANVTIHVTQSDKDNWNAKANSADVYTKAEINGQQTFQDTNLSTHINDTSVHLTSSEKSQLHDGSTQQNHKLTSDGGGTLSLLSDIRLMTNSGTYRTSNATLNIPSSFVGAGVVNYQRYFTDDLDGFVEIKSLANGEVFTAYIYAGGVWSGWFKLSNDANSIGDTIARFESNQINIANTTTPFNIFNETLVAWSEIFNESQVCVFSGTGNNRRLKLPNITNFRNYNIVLRVVLTTLPSNGNGSTDQCLDFDLKSGLTDNLISSMRVTRSSLVRGRGKDNVNTYTRNSTDPMIVDGFKIEAVNNTTTSLSTVKFILLIKGGA